MMGGFTEGGRTDDGRVYRGGGGPMMGGFTEGKVAVANRKV